MNRRIICPMATAFHEDKSIDYEACGRQVERLIENGIGGILFMGSLGEFFTFTNEEKREFAAFAVEKVAGRVQVIIGTGSTVERDVIELSQYAADLGADGVMIVSPYYFKLTTEHLYQFYASVASQTTADIYLYNYPERTVHELDPALVARLAKDFPNIMGLKDTVDSMSHTRTLLAQAREQNPDFIVYSGYDEYLVPNLLSGGNGIISGLTNIAPDLFVKTLRAFEAGDLNEVSRLQKSINLLMGCYAASPVAPAAVKAAVNLRFGGMPTVCRTPCEDLSQDQLNKLKALMERALA